MKLLRAAILLFNCVAIATPQCKECVALPDLIAPAHAIVFGKRSIKTATAHHNGTLAKGVTLETSSRYIELMSKLYKSASNEGLKYPWYSKRIYRSPRPGGTLGPQSFLARIRRQLVTFFRPHPEPSNIPIPSLTLESMVFKTVLESLKEHLQPTSGPEAFDVGISVPVWFTDEQMYHVFLAAEHAHISIREVASVPAAAAAAHDLDLCRIQSDWWPCHAAWVLTLEQTDSTLRVATFTSWQSELTEDYALYKLTNDADETETPDIVEWLHAFVGEKDIAHAYVLGTNGSNALLSKIIKGSRLRAEFQENDAIDAEYIVAYGTAIMAKEAMESQEFDCLEDDSCQEIRREADRLSGKSRFANMFAPQQKTHSEL